MKKDQTENELPATDNNAKHKSRQVKKKVGDTSDNSKQNKK